MRNFGKIVCALYIVAALAFSFNISHNHCTDLYARDAVVVKLNRDGDIVTLQDTQGFVWEFFGCEDWEINDNCACVIDTQGTSEIFDDIILKVTYQG